MILDISEHQANVNYSKLKADGVEAVIIRCGRGQNIVDKRFHEHLKGCQDAGLPVGFYYFSYAWTVEMAQNEADYCYNFIKGIDTKFPIFYDWEYDSMKKALEAGHSPSTRLITDMTKAFCERMKEHGYIPGVYANPDYINNHYIYSEISEYPLWLAQYSGEKSRDCYMWQYTSKGRIAAYNGNLDCSRLYGRPVKHGGTKMGATAQRTIEIMDSWVGMSRSAGTHKPIIDTYNAQNPLPRGYKVKYTDAYCATTVSAAFLRQNDVEAIGGAECSCEVMINQAKAKGLWEEDGTIVPKPGDIIMYNWDKSTQQNDGMADHVGVVKSIHADTVTVIEGNMNGGVVGYRKCPVGWGFIRGFIKPAYKPDSEKRYFSPNLQCSRAMAITFLWKLCGAPETDFVNPFNDVLENNYCYKAVLWAVSKGYISGKSKTLFAPNEPCTRAQFLQMMWRISGSPEVDYEIKFEDVNERAYYYKAVQWASKYGIVAGVSIKDFAPNMGIARAHAVTMMWAAQNKPKVRDADVSINFADVSKDAYYYDPVRWAVSKGITAGTK